MYSFLQQLIDFETVKKYTLHYEDSHIIRCNMNEGVIKGSNNELFNWMKNGLCQFILSVKLNDWIRHIIFTYYHYHDETEQQQIMDIVHSLIEGKHEELASFLPKINIKKQLTAIINNTFQDFPTFSFDSFITFRLRSFMEELKKYVEIALDEYKMEQEYQMFIQTLRDFLQNREAKIKDLHLVFSEDTTFFDEEFGEIKRNEIAKMVDRRLLINHPIYIDSATIAPLLSIAPAKIYAYADDPDKPILRTIRNIFEERLIYRTLSSFAEYRRLHPSCEKKYKTLDF